MSPGNDDDHADLNDDGDDGDDDEDDVIGDDDANAVSCALLFCHHVVGHLVMMIMRIWMMMVMTIWMMMVLMMVMMIIMMTNLTVRDMGMIGLRITISGPIISSVPISVSTSVPDKFTLSTPFFTWLQQLPKIYQNL